MSEDIQVQKSPLFHQLSEKEQAAISGGYPNYLPSGIFLYQKKNIQSITSFESTISDGDRELSHNITSVYQLSETRFLFIPFLFINKLNTSLRHNKSMNWFWNFFT